MIVQDRNRKVNVRWEEGRVKRRVARLLYAVCVFFITLIVAGLVMNQEGDSATTQPGYSTFPVISMQVGSHTVNPLCGYTSEPEMSLIRGTILPVNNDRTIRFYADELLQEFRDLRFEVRNANGTSLVENTKIESLTNASGRCFASFVLKDLIDFDTEYMLVILGEYNDQTIRYYTRFVCPKAADAYHAQQKLDFVRSFHDNSLDKEKASAVSMYIESNAEGDNTSFAHVDIHSSFQQITYGDLEIISHTEPVIRICDLQEQTGEFVLDYTLTFREEEAKVRECRVQEVFQVRFAPERIYLLEYERNMNYLFRGEKADITNGVLQLGVNDTALPMMESDGGSTCAFIVENRLYAYNLTENKLALLYAFDDEVRRQAAMCQEMQILQVDEASNVTFLVSGYLSRGTKEGKTGVVMYRYNAAVNTVEELVYIPSNVSPQILNAGTRQLFYASQDDKVYFMPDRSIYAVDVTDRSVETVVAHIDEDTFRISQSGSKMIWQGAGEENTGTMHLMDFNTGQETVIQAEGDEEIRPLGFMGEDYVYGLMRPTDIRLDAVGNPVYPMYCIRICDVAGNVLENYTKQGIFVTDAVARDNQLYLTRVTFDGATGGYQPTYADQIMDTLPVTESSNRIRTKNLEGIKQVTEIALKSNVDGRNMKLLTPGEILYEESREIHITSSEEEKRHAYYVYDKGEVTGIYSKPAQALRQAYPVFGYVVDDLGHVLYSRGNTVARNQIMSITSSVESNLYAAESAQDSLASCLNLVLNHAGVSRNVSLMLEEGDSAYEVLDSSLPDVVVLDLTGCRVNAMLYYLNKDLPVIAGLNDGKNVLLIGFNERNVVIADPVAGTVEKMGMNDAASFFEQNGNRFLTYFRE